MIKSEDVVIAVANGCKTVDDVLEAMCLEVTADNKLQIKSAVHNLQRRGVKIPTLFCKPTKSTMTTEMMNKILSGEVPAPATPRRQREILDDLTQEAQDMGLGY